jgi:hypothetical protein
MAGVMNGTTRRVSTCRILKLNWLINSSVRHAWDVSITIVYLYF